MNVRTASLSKAGAADRVFAEPKPRLDDFEFNKQVVDVFDDMVDRSVPYYGEIQRMVAELAADFATPEGVIYDFGCSTANSFIAIDRYLPEDFTAQFVGIDSSPEMLDKAQQKLREINFRHTCDFRQSDLNEGVAVNNANVALLVLTLQFVRPMHRDALLKSIYDGLNPNGCLILVEKVLGEHSIFNRLFIKHYYEMKKRNGYSDLEIAQKREALENVLIPYRLEENKTLLRRIGFEHVDVFFKWYNFCGIIAMKL
ncbi:carboxy-S-adenosyl-L-methionine synthase CmoA [Planctomycetales bacterium ZRK34]|nr:carboxy-S-adenosyl-L-methionine synthase CmoA [Planctomycetales bacterium ZRK34]